MNKYWCNSVATGFAADELQSVQIGYDYGCSEPTIEATTNGNSVTIKCQIGRRQDARSVFGERYVDVVVTDIYVSEL